VKRGRQDKMKGLLLLFTGIFLISFISASPGVYKQGEPISLTQTCADCTYINITSITAPNGIQIVGQVEMTKEGSVFNYTLDSSLTGDLGTYRVNGIGDPLGTDEVWTYSFEVTPSGKGGTENTVFFIFIILFLYGITFSGFFGKNIPITILGGMALMFLGVYMITEGIIIYRDNLTNYIAYLTIAMGAITSFWATLEQLEVL
jgi:hypothetical protein